MEVHTTYFSPHRVFCTFLQAAPPSLQWRWCQCLGRYHLLVWAGTSFVWAVTSYLFGQLPVTCLGSYQLLYRSGCPHCLHLMTAHLVYWRCLMPSLCSSSTFFLRYQVGFLGCGSPPGPKGSANHSLVSAVPEVSGGKMKTNGGAATSGTACGGASGGEGRGG